MSAQSPKTAQSESDPLLRPGSFMSSNGRTPPPPTPPGQTPEKGKRKAPEGEIDWLPDGWKVEDRVRTSGATAGSVDRYYFDPISKRKFRSKKEVLYFLETGTPRKKSKTENSSAEAKPKEKSDGEKSKLKEKSGGAKSKPSTKEKKGSAANFNFTKLPEKVKWVLSDSSTSGDSWNAFIGDKQVSESKKLDWLAAFTLLASKDRGRYQ